MGFSGTILRTFGGSSNGVNVLLVMKSFDDLIRRYSISKLNGNLFIFNQIVYERVENIELVDRIYVFAFEMHKGYYLNDERALGAFLGAINIIQNMEINY